MHIFNIGMKVVVVDFNEVGKIIDVKVGEDNNTLYKVQTDDGMSAWFLAIELDEI